MRERTWPDTHLCTQCGLPIDDISSFWQNKNGTRRHSDGECSIAVQDLVSQLVGIPGFDFMWAVQEGMPPREFGKALRRDEGKAKQLGSEMHGFLKRREKEKGEVLSPWTSHLAFIEFLQRVRNERHSSFARHLPLVIDPEPLPDPEAVWHDACDIHGLGLLRR